MSGKVNFILMKKKIFLFIILSLFVSKYVNSQISSESLKFGEVLSKISQLHGMAELLLKIGKTAEKAGIIGTKKKTRKLIQDLE